MRNLTSSQLKTLASCNRSIKSNWTVCTVAGVVDNTLQLRFIIEKQDVLSFLDATQTNIPG